MTKTPEELTADWKAGKLKDGAYYIQTDVDITIAFFKKAFNVQKIQKIKGFIPKDRLKKVLSPVPAYDGYKAMQDQIADASKMIEWLAEHEENCCCFENEVMQLKLAEMEELLKECKRYIDFYCVPDGFGKSYIAEDLLTRINAALGCNETQANPIDCNKMQESEER